MMTTPVSPTASGGDGSLFAPAGGQLGKDEFLQLLVAQLRNQDPLNPMQAQDMAVQLAQFTSVEQLINLNEQIAQQAAYSEALVHGFSTSSAMGVLGRTVLARTDRVAVTGADDAVTLNVGEPGGTATLKLLDADGKEVGSRDLGRLDAGRVTVELGDAAASLEPGTYTIEVEVTDAEGEPVPVETYATVRIDGVRYGEEGLVLVAGQLELTLQSILEVFANS